MPEKKNPNISTGEMKLNVVHLASLLFIWRATCEDIKRQTHSSGDPREAAHPAEMDGSFRLSMCPLYDRK